MTRLQRSQAKLGNQKRKARILRKIKKKGFNAANFTVIQDGKHTIKQ